MATTSQTLSRLQSFAAAVLLFIFVQAGIGIGMLTSAPGWMFEAHAYVGYANFIAAIVAAVLAFQYSKQEPSAKGMFFHALSLPVLAFVQIGLAEMAGGNEALKWVHVALGVAYLVDAFGLFAMARKRSGNSI